MARIGQQMCLPWPDFPTRRLQLWLGHSDIKHDKCDRLTHVAETAVLSGSPEQSVQHGRFALLVSDLGIERCFGGWIDYLEVPKCCHFPLPDWMTANISRLLQPVDQEKLPAR
jgi:hypothetical protein